MNHVPPFLEEFEIERMEKHGDPFWKRVAATIRNLQVSLKGACARERALMSERDQANAGRAEWFKKYIEAIQA